MPTYNNSKSQKRSKSQSKSGGRRKKQTMRKLRRGKKSRKVMRGGANISNKDTFEKFFAGKENLKQELLAAFSGKDIDSLVLEMRGQYKNFDTKLFLEKPELANASDELKAHLNS